MHQTPETHMEKQWDLYSLKKLHLFLLSSLPQGSPNTVLLWQVKSRKGNPDFMCEVQQNEKKKKKKDPSLLSFLTTSCFGKPRLLLTSAKEYKAKLCWPGKLLHRGGSCGSIDLFMWGSAYSQHLNVLQQCWTHWADKGINTGLEHTRKVHGQSQQRPLRVL